MKNKTNLDKLHESKDPDVRGNGKTFDDCHTVAGLVGLKEELIVCLVPNFSRVSFIREMLLTVLAEMQYKVSKITEREIWCENSSILFLSKDLTCETKGYKTCAIVEFKD